MPRIEKEPHRPWKPKKEVQSGREEENKAFYQSRRWRKVRALKIARNPICEECAKKGVVSDKNLVVDHIKPINQGGAPLDMENLQTLCSPCHNRKSGREARKQ